MTVDELITVLAKISNDGHGECLVETCNCAGDMADVDFVSLEHVYCGPRKGDEVVRVYT